MAFLGALSGSVLFYCLFILCLNSFFTKRIRLSQRLTEAERINNPIEYQEPEHEYSFGESVIKPAFSALISVFSVFIPPNAEYLKRTEQQLKQAGIRMSARNYTATTLLVTVIAVVVGALYGYLLKRSLGYVILMALLGLYAGYVIIRFYLKSRITKRKKDIYHQLPEMLDLLCVSVSAGLGFNQALAYVVQKCEGALFDELDMAQREIALGRSRREALTGFADRCDNLEVRTFVTAVLQADEMGASMQNILRVQADTIRLTHKQAVEEEAQKLAVKILIPLIFFIFPVMLIVLMGPAFMSIKDALVGVTM